MQEVTDAEKLTLTAFCGKRGEDMAFTQDEYRGAPASLILARS